MPAPALPSVLGHRRRLPEICRDETDISNASRPIKPTELEACRKAGIDFIELPVAFDGIAIVVNPKNTWVTSITVAD